MSWIRDQGDVLINLDKVERITIEGVEGESPGSETYGVFLWLDPDDEHLVFQGTETECAGFVRYVSSKLHMVNPPHG